jgi:hypothetical protein
MATMVPRFVRRWRNGRHQSRAQGSNGGKQLAAVADRGDTETDQVFGREVSQDLGIDIVLAERLLISSQPQTAQPSRDIHGLLPAPYRQSKRCLTLPEKH